MTSPAGNQAGPGFPARELEELIQQWSKSTPVAGVGAQPVDTAKVMLPVVKAIAHLDETMNENVEAVKSFDRASRKLTYWLIALTIVLVVCTVAVTWFTVLLWMRG